MSADLDASDQGSEVEVERLRNTVRASAQELRLSRQIQAESRREAEVSRAELVEIRRHRDQIQGELATACAELAAVVHERDQLRASHEGSLLSASAQQWRERAEAAEAGRAELEAWIPVRIAFRAQAFLLRHALLRRIALRIGRFVAPRSS